jgi:hypothetical protein
MQGCVITEDAETPWCFVAEREQCLEVGGKASDSVPGEVWDFCYLGDETEHKCICENSWDYGGHQLQGCNYTSDHESYWCYIRTPCSGSIKTHKHGEYWDECNITEVMEQRERFENVSGSVSRHDSLLIEESPERGRLRWSPSWEATLAAQMDSDSHASRHRKPPQGASIQPQPLQQWGNAVADVAKSPPSDNKTTGLVQQAAAAAWAYVA